MHQGDIQTKYIKRTLGQVIKTVFPEGTESPFNVRDTQISTGGQTDKPQPDEPFRWQMPPTLPFDMFAVCSHIVEISGLMGFFEPNDEYPTEFIPSEQLRISISNSDKAACDQAARDWLDTSRGFPPLVSKLWRELLDYWSHPVIANEYQGFHKRGNKTAPSPRWWSAVFRLLRIADEACSNIGHVLFGQSTLAPFTHQFAESRFRTVRAGDSPLAQGSSKFMKMGKGVFTYASIADTTVVTVQPKVRVARLGVTLRNISRNLAITGSSGQVSCGWQQLSGPPKAEEDAGLDIVIIPMPYEIPARLFKPKSKVTHGAPTTGESHNWGSFEIQQEWLPSTEEEKANFLSDIEKLIKQAKNDVTTINGVIFPEFSLNYDIFLLVAEHIAKVEPEVEFLIAGTSSNCDNENCNSVMTAIWERSVVDHGSQSNSSETANRITSQKKHHRWRLDRRQLADYTLSATLHPDRDWWEDHQISQRELNFFQFRRSSVFCSVICEDLARNDPVHEIIRSIAPNIVFALLMDGAQIPNRWPARYASTLADDPGCSVLTITSFGLIKRVNENSIHPRSDSIGLWKDETGNTVQIKLPDSARGTLISLSAVKTQDVTIDGRVTNDARSWRFNGQKPLYI